MVEYFLMGIRSFRTLKNMSWIRWGLFQKEVLLLTLGTSMLEFVKAEIVKVRYIKF